MGLSRALAVLVVASAAASAQQTVQGRVTDRTSGIPVAGVVVSGLDSTGTPLVRAVTDSASGYRIPILAGMQRLQFRRIGYSPSEAALKDSVNGRLDVTMTRLPTRLPPIKAVVTAQCDANANGADVLALWDQARSGMLTSLVAHDSKATYTSVLLYQNGFKGDDAQPRAVDRVELPAGTSHAFSTGVSPDTLAKYGYLVRDGLQNAFLGPDEAVLFDESFLATHCFTADTGPQGADSLIGVRFTAGKGTKNVEVEGVVWLRRDPLDLASMEYSYTNIEHSLQRAHPGGSYRFQRMPNGITMISEWRIRSAKATGSVTAPGRTEMVRGGFIPGRGSIRGGPPPTIRRVPPVVTTAVNATETGAVIEMMQWTDAPPFMAALGSVSGVLIDRQTKKPLRNTPVRFYRTPFVATTDSTGAFAMLDVLPGMYELDAGNFDLEKFEAAPELTGPIAIRYGANDLKVEVDGPDAVVQRGCREKMDGRVDMPKALAGSTVLFGMVVSDRGGVPDAEFHADVLLAGAVPGTPPFSLKGKTDRFGRFRLCGLPNSKVTVWTQVRDLGDSQEAVTDPQHPYQIVTLRLKKPTGMDPSPYRH